jgi:hypothetical protein
VSPRVLFAKKDCQFSVSNVTDCCVAFENVVLREIFPSKENKLQVASEWNKLRIQKFHNVLFGWLPQARRLRIGYNMRSEVLTAVKMSVFVFCVVTLVDLQVDYVIIKTFNTRNILNS